MEEKEMTKKRLLSEMSREELETLVTAEAANFQRLIKEGRYEMSEWALQRCGTIMIYLTLKGEER